MLSIRCLGRGSTCSHTLRVRAALLRIVALLRRNATHHLLLRLLLLLVCSHLARVHSLLHPARSDPGAVALVRLLVLLRRWLLRVLLLLVVWLLRLRCRHSILLLLRLRVLHLLRRRLLHRLRLLLRWRLLWLRLLHSVSARRVRHLHLRLLRHRCGRLLSILHLLRRSAAHHLPAVLLRRCLHRVPRHATGLHRHAAATNPATAAAPA